MIVCVWGRNGFDGSAEVGGSGSNLNWEIGGLGCVSCDELFGEVLQLAGFVCNSIIVVVAVIRVINLEFGVHNSEV